MGSFECLHDADPGHARDVGFNQGTDLLLWKREGGREGEKAKRGEFHEF